MYIFPLDVVQGAPLPSWGLARMSKGARLTGWMTGVSASSRPAKHSAALGLHSKKITLA